MEFGKEWKNLIFNGFFALVTLLIPAFFYTNIILATVLLVVLTIIGLIKWKSWVTFVLFIFVALWGPVSEMLCIHLGVWNYSHPNFYTIPIWLSLVWGNAACFIYQTALEIKKFGIKK